MNGRPTDGRARIFSRLLFFFTVLFVRRGTFSHTRRTKRLAGRRGPKTRLQLVISPDARIVVSRASSSAARLIKRGLNTKTRIGGTPAARCCSPFDGSHAQAVIPTYLFNGKANESAQARRPNKICCYRYWVIVEPTLGEDFLHCFFPAPGQCM